MYKVLCLESPSMDRFTMEQWGIALADLYPGSNLVLWEPTKKAAFDIFDEYEPDIFIGTTRDITKGIATCLIERPELISILYDTTSNEISSEDLSCVLQLKAEAGKPDYIFNFSCNQTLLDTWKNLGYNTLNIMRAVNTFLAKPGQISREWSTDISFMGDYVPYLDKYILPLCNRSDTKVRLYGNGWPVIQGVGSVKPENWPNIFSNSKIVVDITDTPFEPSNIFTHCISSKNLCLSNCQSASAGKDIYFEKPQELHNLITLYLNDNTIRLNVKEKQNLEFCTYSDTVFSLLTQLII